MFRRHPLLAMRQICFLEVIAFFGQLCLFMAVNRSAALSIVLLIVQWGLIHLSIPLFSGLSNVHIPDSSRATALILISAIVTGYVAFGGWASWPNGRSRGPLPFSGRSSSPAVSSVVSVEVSLRGLGRKLDRC
jgi:hypothetical protein